MVYFLKYNLSDLSKTILERSFTVEGQDIRLNACFSILSFPEKIEPRAWITSLIKTLPVFPFLSRLGSCSDHLSTLAQILNPVPDYDLSEEPDWLQVSFLGGIMIERFRDKHPFTFSIFDSYPAAFIYQILIDHGNEVIEKMGIALVSRACLEKLETDKSGTSNLPEVLHTYPISYLERIGLEESLHRPSLISYMVSEMLPKESPGFHFIWEAGDTFEIARTLMLDRICEGQTAAACMREVISSTWGFFANINNNGSLVLPTSVF